MNISNVGIVWLLLLLLIHVHALHLRGNVLLLLLLQVLCTGPTEENVARSRPTRRLLLRLLLGVVRRYVRTGPCTG